MTTTTPLPTVKRARTRFTHVMAARMLGLPRPTGDHTVEKDIAVPTRDGEALLTDHFWPTSRVADATILIRTPYGRGFPNNLAYGATLAEAGYHVLIQSVRGTNGSSASFVPFVKETDDALDTLVWLRQQEWFDGRLATVGGSYLGYVQWALQRAAPEELKASVIIVGPHDPARMIYRSGAFALADQFSWSEGVSTQEHHGRLRGLLHLLSAERRHAGVLNRLPLTDAGAEALDGRAPWYREWLMHPEQNDRYWLPYQPGDLLERTSVPTLLIGGWDDAFLDQTLEQYTALRDAGRDVSLVVGPWNHMHTATKALGELTTFTLDWFEQHVRSAAPTEPHAHPVRMFVIGANEWREYVSWPPPVDQVQLHLNSGQRLSSEPGDGSSSFTYDPGDPTPTVGGRILSPRGAGSRDNRSLERRADVITFSSEPLPRAVELLGPPVLELALQVDNPHSDVFARVCIVDKRGVSRNLSDGFLRLDPKGPADQEQKVILELDPRAQRLPAGCRIRLQLSGGAHPRWARNLGTDEPLGEGVTLVRSHHSVSHAGSTLTLPMRVLE